MRNRILLAAGLVALLSFGTRAQESTVSPADNLVADGIVKIPASLAETAGRYGSFRSAGFVDWSPANREMVIAKRIADKPHVDLVAQPGGAREHVTAFSGSVADA